MFPLLATVAFALTSMAVPACAQGDVVIDDAGSEPPATTPTTQPVVDAGPKETAAPTCVSSCSADSECENSCPKATSGASCCDTQTHKCYHNTSSCPVPVVDSGIDPGPY